MVIGIYDSGLGGLSVWRELRQHLSPALLYFGDTAHIPYGEKTSTQLQSYFWDILAFLKSKECVGVVVACNTASALVLPEVKEKAGIPLIGIIEGAVQATLAVGQGKVGVLATRATTESGVYQRAFRIARPSWQVFVHSAPRLAPMVEQGQISGPLARQIVEEYLTPLLEKNIDTLLLGCTHYPFLHPIIEEIVGSGVRIVDPAFTLAKQVSEWLPNLGKVENCQRRGTEFWVSDKPEKFQKTAHLLLHEDIPSVGLYQASGERA